MLSRRWTEADHMLGWQNKQPYHFPSLLNALILCCKGNSWGKCPKRFNKSDIRDLNVTKFNYLEANEFLEPRYEIKLLPYSGRKF